MKRLLLLASLAIIGFVTMAPIVNVGFQDIMNETGIRPDGDLKSLPVGKSMTGVVMNPVKAQELGFENARKGAKATMFRKGKDLLEISVDGDKVKIQVGVLDCM